MQRPAEGTKGRSSYSTGVEPGDVEVVTEQVMDTFV